MDAAAVDGCPRQIDFLDGEIAILERGIADTRPARRRSSA
jgi:hypothetical protein